jgi:hypothetical protein
MVNTSPPLSQPKDFASASRTSTRIGTGFRGTTLSFHPNLLHAGALALGEDPLPKP